MRRSSRGVSFVTTVLLAISTSACTAFQTGQTKLQAVKTVGIISAIGDQITFAKGGLTPLDNRSQSFPIGSWGIDELIVQQATVTLSGRFQVQPVSYNRAVFADIEKESSLTPVNLMHSDRYKKLVQTDVSPQGLDAYIVITKAKANFGGGSRKVEGIGLVSYTTVLESYNQIHALYEIRVIDGRTFEIIEKRTAPPLDDAEAVRLQGPSRLTKENFSPGADPTQNENLHRAITDLVARSLSTTLGDLHLADIR